MNSVDVGFVCMYVCTAGGLTLPSFDSTPGLPILAGFNDISLQAIFYPTMFTNILLPVLYSRSGRAEA